MFVALWILWGVIFGVFETLAITSKKMTLSQFMWAFQGRSKIRKAMLLVGMLVLTSHFILQIP